MGRGSEGMQFVDSLERKKKEIGKGKRTIEETFSGRKVKRKGLTLNFISIAKDSGGFPS